MAQDMFDAGPWREKVFDRREEREEGGQGKEEGARAVKDAAKPK